MQDRSWAGVAETGGGTCGGPDVGNAGSRRAGRALAAKPCLQRAQRVLGLRVAQLRVSPGVGPLHQGVVHKSLQHAHLCAGPVGGAGPGQRWGGECWGEGRCA